MMLLTSRKAKAKVTTWRPRVSSVQLAIKQRLLLHRQCYCCRLARKPYDPGGISMMLLAGCTPERWL